MDIRFIKIYINIYIYIYVCVYIYMNIQIEEMKDIYINLVYVYM